MTTAAAKIEDVISELQSLTSASTWLVRERIKKAITTLGYIHNTIKRPTVTYNAGRFWWNCPVCGLVRSSDKYIEDEDRACQSCKA